MIRNPSKIPFARQHTIPITGNVSLACALSAIAGLGVQLRFWQGVAVGSGRIRGGKGIAAILSRPRSTGIDFPSLARVAAIDQSVRAISTGSSDLVVYPLQSV